MTTKKATATKTTTPKKPATTKIPPSTETKAQDNPDNGKRVAELLDKLKDAELVGEKKAIRRRLRALGHKGGLKGE